MEEASSKGDSPGNLSRQSSLRPPGSFKSPLSGRYGPRVSPAYRKLYSSRISHRESKGGSGKFQWFRGNRVVFLLILIALWAYLGFHVQSQWAHNNQNKPGFIVYNNNVEGESKVKDIIRISRLSLDNAANATTEDPVILNDSKEPGSTKFGVGLIRKSRHISSHKKITVKKNSKRVMLERKLRSNIPVQPTPPAQPKVAVTYNRTADLDEGIPRKNTSYGLLVGPFTKTAESVLDWSPDKRKGTCDRKGDFARLIWSRKFVLIFPELSMISAPITMMELATELLSCGGYVSVVTVSRKGGLMGELARRGIKVLDNGELAFKTSMKADLIIAGSASSSTWIEQYLSRFTAGSSQILWWIMENQRESFDRAKKVLDQVKMLAFLSEVQSNQWLKWCEEEKIQLKTQPEIVPLSINDELAFVAGIPCSLNTPSFTVEKMQERRSLLRVAVRKEMGLSDNDILVLSLGSINPEKGQLFLLESALLMSDKKLPLIDVNINSFIDVKNTSGVAIAKDDEHSRGIKLEDDAHQTNATIVASKKKKRHSRLSKKARQQDTRRSRNLLAKSEDIRDPSIRFLIGSVGSKSNKVPYIKELLKFLSKHPNVSKALFWTPATTHVSPIYAAADVYVINAQGLGEAFDRGTIEAMAFGLPVLGTDAGSTREIVEDKVTGLLHPIGEDGTRPLALNLRFLQSNPAAKKQLGSSGRLKVEKMYLKRHMYKKLAKIFTLCMKVK